METISLEHFIERLQNEVIYPERIEFLFTDSYGRKFNIKPDRIESVGGTTIRFIES